MITTPVLFIIFNRPDTTELVFSAIRQAKPALLFVAADAPRIGNKLDEEKCIKARAIIDQVDWPCTVHTLYRDNNLGCGLAVSEAINWFFSHCDEGIILEDDCLPNPDFFNFASEMLHIFRNNQQVISINGSNLGYQFSSNGKYFFSRFMNMWGWATWKDRAEKIDYEMRTWSSIRRPKWWLYRKLRQHYFDLDLNWYELWRSKFNKVASDRNFTWDWQWIFHQIAHNQLSIVPSVNLVSNIGFNTEATHTLASDNPAANIPSQALTHPYFGPNSFKPDFTYEEECVKWVWCYHKRVPVTKWLKIQVKKLFYHKL